MTQNPVDTSCLSEGFDGSGIFPGPNHTTIELWYDTEDQAIAARRVFNKLIDGATPTVETSEIEDEPSLKVLAVGVAVIAAGMFGLWATIPYSGWVLAAGIFMLASQLN